METHKLKVWPEYFKDLLSGKKTFELRKNDRDYQVGDHLILEEFNPETSAYSGGHVHRTITHILHGPAFGLEEGSVIMSIVLQD